MFSYSMLCYYSAQGTISCSEKTIEPFKELEKCTTDAHCRDFTKSCRVLTTSVNGNTQVCMPHTVQFRYIPFFRN